MTTVLVILDDFSRSIKSYDVTRAVFLSSREARLPPLRMELWSNCRRGQGTFCFSVDCCINLFYIAEEMKHGELLGSLEYIVLLALARLDESAYGLLVLREIAARTGRNLSIGAVYGTLERLEETGYISSSTGDPTPERGGRAKRLFRIEAAGKRALNISSQTIRSMTAGLKGQWELP